MNTSSLFFSLLIGAIGSAYMLYGKRSDSWLTIFCGIALCTIPSVSNHLITTIALSVSMIILPFLASHL